MVSHQNYWISTARVDYTWQLDATALVVLVAAGCIGATEVVSSVAAVVAVAHACCTLQCCSQQFGRCK